MSNTVSNAEGDSLWLQNSITVPDPLPEVTGTTPVAQRTAYAAAAADAANTTTPARNTNEEEEAQQPTKPADSEAEGVSTQGAQSAMMEMGGSTPPTQSTAAAAVATAPSSTASTPAMAARHVGCEMELTRMLLDTAGLGLCGMPSAAAANSLQRASVSRYSSARMSMSNAAFISTQEYDDLRAKYSQAKRELLKVSDVQKDLDYARFELTRAQEELKLTVQSHSALKQELEDAVARAERACKAKAALEAMVGNEAALAKKEAGFLKAQVEQLRDENAKRLAELAEQQESESQGRIQSMRDELVAVSEEVQAMTTRAEELQRERERLQSACDSTAAALLAAQEAVAERERRLADARAQLEEQQQAHSNFVHDATRDRDEAVRAQQALGEQRAEQITRTKDACITELKEELQEVKEKWRDADEERAALRHSTRQLTEEVRQLAADHGKEVRRLVEEHKLALCERDLQLEATLREAKGSRAAVEETGQSLRRQLAKTSEELSTVAAILSQRERQLAEAEREVTGLKERVLLLEQDNMQLASDAEMHATAAEEAGERVRRLNSQKDSLEEEYSGDLRAAKERVRELEASLMRKSEELSAMRREQLLANDSGRAATKDLRAEIDALTEERNRLAQALGSNGEAQSAAEEFRKKYAAEKQRSDALTVELAAMTSCIGLLEQSLDEERRRAISRAVHATTSPSSRPSLTPASGTAAAGGAADRRRSSALRLRSVSSANARQQPSSAGSSLKRARTEDARVFAISGFDGNEMLQSIKQLPSVAIAECKSNSPVPSNLTHLITNGQLTIKLLTALVRGCWVLPEAYVVESLKQRTWLDERDYGFQHEEPPLLKKRILVTDNFTACKYYSTAVLLLREGGAITDDEQMTPESADMVLCTGSETDEFGDKAIRWEQLMDVVNPVNVK